MSQRLTSTFKEPAQNGGDVKRAPQGNSEVLPGLGARIRPLCAISTLIVDDEELARDELSFLLKDFPEIEVIETAANGLEAVKLIADLEPDLVFLDVQMPGVDGLGVIRSIRARGGEQPHFVLTTAFDQYAVEAFRAEALDYLLKPVEKERLAESVARASAPLGKNRIRLE